jgi:hypothetical protein
MFGKLNMDVKDWIIVSAIIIGPILAIQIQKLIENYREKRLRRLSIFKTLMSTRAERLARDHVQALNMIDIEFYGKRVFGTRFQTKKEKAVTNAWKNYNSHLGERSRYETDDPWLKRCDELFTKLLYNMSQALGYDYDEVQLSRDCYRPILHGNIENAQLAILLGFESVLKGEKSLPIVITNVPGPASPEPNELKGQSKPL